MWFPRCFLDEVLFVYYTEKETMEPLAIGATGTESVHFQI